MEKITYKKSLQAKLVLSQDALAHYQSIRDCCAVHKKVTTRLSFNKETISFGRVKVGVIKMAVKNISLHLALNPMDYVNTKYHFKDMSHTKQGQVFPLRVNIKGSRSLKYALELLEDTFTKVGATILCEAPAVDYTKPYYPRSFDVLLKEGLIKKYVKTMANSDEPVFMEEQAFEKKNHNEKEERVSVSLTAKLLYEASNQASNLYVVSNYNGWDPKKGVQMKKSKDGSFHAQMSFPKNTDLQFKICRFRNWDNVEKGIWKEEIENHHYYADEDMEIEDLIHNFRED